MTASRTIRVASSHGLHARPAKLFVEAAQGAGSPVKIAKGGKQVDAASILGVLSLGVNQGDEVELTVEGDGAETVLDRLEEFLLADHDADPAA